MNLKTVSLKSFTLLLTILLFLSVQAQSQAESQDWSDLINQISSTLNQAKKNIWNQIQPNQPVWNMPPWLGTFFISEYHFELKALNITGDFQLNSQFNQTFFTQKLIKEQSQDGSWHQLVDLNKKQGSLDATIFNYWYLKDVGLDQNSETMKKAKKFILDHGGIEEAQMMTKYKLAAFGQYEWHLVNYVPLFIFKNWFPYSIMYIKDYVAQWVYPHLIGLAYLRYHKTIFPVSKVCLSELRTSRSTVCEEELAKHPGTLGFKKLQRDTDVENLLQQGIKLTGRRGAVGAYTISTLLYLLSFKDFTLRYNNEEMIQYYNSNVMKSMQFVEEMYFNRRVSYEGSLDDGRYWDTLLASLALLEAGENIEKLHPTVEFMINTAVQPNGGIPYGQEFQYAPDIDDTAMLLFLYGIMNKKMTGNYSFGTYAQQINRTYTWLKSTQNDDGGFPAFDKDKNDDQYKLIKYIFKITRIDKSAEIFDPSCADIVGHLLEGMGENGIYDTEVIDRAVRFLYETRKDGMWSARWGINYIYAVGAVFPGLARVGYNLNQTWLLDIVRRMKGLQQDDGGFGEDSDSYNLDCYKKGSTTVSMTAWGLLAYLEVAEYMDVNQNIVGAVQYILNNFKENGKRFYDRSVVGTGHRGLLNLQYPVYAYSFPVIALARARVYFSGQRKPFINDELNLKVIQYELSAYSKVEEL